MDDIVFFERKMSGFERFPDSGKTVVCVADLLRTCQTQDIPMSLVEEMLDDAPLSFDIVVQYAMILDRQGIFRRR